jgi:hypothetical protein
MRDGRFNTSKCRGKLQKMGVLCTHPLKQPRPLQHARALKNFFFKKFQKTFKKNANALSMQAVAGRRPLVTARRGPRSPSQRPLLRGSHFIQPPYPLFPTSLPPNFSTCDQLFFIGSSIGPPCPDFSSKLQTSITFGSIGPKNTIFFPVKLAARCISTKSCKKSKNSVSSSDTDQSRFVHHTDIWSFRG